MRAPQGLAYGCRAVASTPSQAAILPRLAILAMVARLQPVAASMLLQDAPDAIMLAMPALLPIGTGIAAYRKKITAKSRAAIAADTPKTNNGLSCSLPIKRILAPCLELVQIKRRQCSMSVVLRWREVLDPVPNWLI